MSTYQARVSLVEFYAEGNEGWLASSAEEARAITLNNVVSDELPADKWNIVVEDWKSADLRWKVTAETTIVVEANYLEEAEEKVYDILRFGYALSRDYLVDIKRIKSDWKIVELS